MSWKFLCSIIGGAVLAISSFCFAPADPINPADFLRGRRRHHHRAWQEDQACRFGRTGVGP
jgi:hypothetical protein